MPKLFDPRFYCLGRSGPLTNLVCPGLSFKPDSTIYELCSRPVNSGGFRRRFLSVFGGDQIPRSSLPTFTSSKEICVPASVGCTDRHVSITLICSRNRKPKRKRKKLMKDFESFNSFYVDLLTGPQNRVYKWRGVFGGPVGVFFSKDRGFFCSKVSNYLRRNKTRQGTRCHSVPVVSLRGVPEQWKKEDFTWWS